MEKQQRRINAQYNEDRHELETAINIIFDKHFGRHLTLLPSLLGVPLF
jgi:hypothetical protein